MPGHGAREMAGPKGKRTVAGSLLPRRIYATAENRQFRSTECARDLPSPVPRGIGDAAHHRGRPKAPGGRYRLSCCAAHMGTESAFASSSTLCRSRRRHQSRRPSLDWMQETVVLSPGRGFEQPLSESVPDLSAGSIPGRQTEVSWRDGRTRAAGRVRSLVPTSTADQMGRLCEASLWRSRAGSQVSGPLHPSGGNLESAAIVDGKWLRDL